MSDTAGLGMRGRRPRTFAAGEDGRKPLDVSDDGQRPLTGRRPGRDHGGEWKRLETNETQDNSRCQRTSKVPTLSTRRCAVTRPSSVRASKVSESSRVSELRPQRRPLEGGCFKAEPGALRIRNRIISGVPAAWIWGQRAGGLPRGTAQW